MRSWPTSARGLTAESAVNSTGGLLGGSDRSKRPQLTAAAGRPHGRWVLAGPCADSSSRRKGVADTSHVGGTPSGGRRCGGCEFPAAGYTPVRVRDSGRTAGAGNKDRRRCGSPTGAVGWRPHRGWARVVADGGDSAGGAHLQPQRHLVPKVDETRLLPRPHSASAIPVSGGISRVPGRGRFYVFMVGTRQGIGRHPATSPALVLTAPAGTERG